MLKIAFILLFIGLAASESSISSVIARILSQAKSSKANTPVILVINNRALQDSSNEDPFGEPSFAEPLAVTSEENSLQKGISMMSVLSQLQKPRAKSQYRPRPRVQRKPQRLPVYKSLLSLRNSLRCGAQNECKDECSELPKKKQNKCDRKCEKKYECDEEPECGDDDCNDDSSTKGPPPDEECSRC